MTILDDRPSTPNPADTVCADARPRMAWRMHRRYELVVSGGLGGALHTAQALHDCGIPVRDFSVEVREGVPYSSVFATMSMSDDEVPRFAEHMLAQPSVLAVDPS